MNTKEIIHAIREPDEKFIKRHMARCKHFTGIQNKICLKGVVYKEVQDGTTFPCFTGNSYIQPNDKCELREFPTKEEAVATLENMNKRTKSLLEGKCPDCGAKLIDDAIEEGKYAGHGCYICPVCKKVKMQI